MIEATNTKKRPRLGPKPRIESRRQFDQEIHKEGVCDMIRGDFDSNCENDSLYGVFVMLMQKLVMRMMILMN